MRREEGVKFVSGIVVMDNDGDEVSVNCPIEKEEIEVISQPLTVSDHGEKENSIRENDNENEQGTPGV